MGQPDEPPTDWSKDFVEHLRTVHFSLITLSIALLVISTGDQDQYYNAYSQLQLIKKVSNEWKNGVQNLLRVSSCHYLSEPGRQPTADQQSKVDEQSSYQQAKLQECTPYLSTADLSALRIEDGSIKIRPSLDIADLCTDENGRRVLKNHSLDTIGQISDFWNRFSKAPALTCITDVGQPVLQVDGKSKNPTVTKNLQGAAVGDIPIPLSPEPQTRAAEQLRGEVDADGHKILVTFKVTRAPLLQLNLGIMHDVVSGHLWGDPSGRDPFDLAFPDLNGVAKTLALYGETLQKSADRLATHMDKPEATTTIFGIAIAVRQLTTWGSFLLVGIQLYLWIHLRELTSRLSADSAGWRVAWIGVYDRSTAKLMSKASAALAPPVTTLMLAKLAINLWTFSAISASVLVALLTYRQFDSLMAKGTHATAVAPSAPVGPTMNVFGEGIQSAGPASIPKIDWGIRGLS
ncbi:MAG TPA: hypothetical protein VKY85_07985 [Candidatus Angelobacter sp.]|nr:hypothetical protein [Candidatus Angelobacter sp.]